jgi:hypothetical protein
MDDRERMLNEGPREAPEPPTADAWTAGDAARPATRAPAPPSTRPGGRRGRSFSWYRFVPIVLVAALTGGRALGDGFGGLIVVGVIVAVGLIEYIRRRAL